MSKTMTPTQISALQQFSIAWKGLELAGFEQEATVELCRDSTARVAVGFYLPGMPAQMAISFNIVDVKKG